jgi:membrane protein YqaA with SNARE-associated domain
MLFYYIRKLYDWMGSKVHTPYATLWLAALFFIEAVFFVPVDPLLILFCIERQKKSLFYATVATIASVMGGIAGYFIGRCAWDICGVSIVHTFITQETFSRLVEYYTMYQNWLVLFAGFTPFPYKVITLSAGFCKVSFVPFVLCSLIARGTRFFLLGSIIYVWGEKMRGFIDRSFNQLVLLFTLLLLISIGCVRW